MRITFPRSAEEIHPESLLKFLRRIGCENPKFSGVEVSQFPLGCLVKGSELNRWWPLAAIAVLVGRAATLQSEVPTWDLHIPPEQLEVAV